MCDSLEEYGQLRQRPLRKGSDMVIWKKIFGKDHTIKYHKRRKLTKELMTGEKIFGKNHSSNLTYNKVA